MASEAAETAAAETTPPAAAGAQQLTEDEATVYDRQLRVWGVEVQKKLTAARVLIVGFGKLAAEVAKNITLAGVGSVTLLDDTPAADHDGRNFLIPSPAPAGVGCTEAAARTLQAMNPLVRVSAAAGPAPARLADAAFLASHDLVVCAGAPLRAAAATGDAAARAGVKFMAAAVRGAAGFYFADLGRHAYLRKADTAGPGGGGAGDKAPAAPQEQAVHYVRLSKVLATPLVQLPGNCHPLVPVLLACSALEEELGHPLAPDDTDAAAGKLQQMLSGTAAGASAAVAPWAAEAARLLPAWVCGGAGLAAGEFAPTAAVIGGVMGNDIIRAVSHSDAPINNMFLYTLSGRSLVHTLPPPGDGAAAAAAGVGAAAAAAAAAGGGGSANTGGGPKDGARRSSKAAGEHEQQRQKRKREGEAASAAEEDDVVLVDD